MRRRGARRLSSLVNTFLALAIDVRREARHRQLTGRLSGPAIRPIAVRMVHEASQAVGFPWSHGRNRARRGRRSKSLQGATAVEVGTASSPIPRRETQHCQWPAPLVRQPQRFGPRTPAQWFGKFAHSYGSFLPLPSFPQAGQPPEHKWMRDH